MTSSSLLQTNGQTERKNSTIHTILNPYKAEHPQMWDQLVEALTLAYNGLPHRNTGVAPLELVNPMGVSSWVFKDRTRTRKYPLTAQCGTAAEERARAALLTLLVPLIPQMTAILNATQGRYMREHDTSLALPAERLIVEGCAWQRDHAKVGCAGRTLTLVAREPYRVVSCTGPRSSWTCMESSAPRTWRTSSTPRTLPSLVLPRIPR